jgi:hypothetical protein
VHPIGGFRRSGHLVVRHPTDPLHLHGIHRLGQSAGHQLRDHVLRHPIDAGHNSARLSSCALMATITVLADMKTAPRAGVRRTPHAASTPAANGIATML